MMTPEDWKSVRHFEPSEFSAPERMDYDFVKQLDAYRAKLGESVLINYSNGQEQHAAGSLHYEGKAADIMFHRHVTLDDWMMATRFFTEVGLYRDWERDGQVLGGLHVGYERFALSYAMQRKYWIGYKREGATLYVPFSLANLKALNLL